MDERRRRAVSYASPPARLLAADPGWEYDDDLPGGGRGARKSYLCEPVEAIAAMPLPELDPLGCVLALWRTGTHQSEAVRVAEAWGFRPFGELVWIKLRPCSLCDGLGSLRGVVCPHCRGEGGTSFMGMGRRGPRNGHEIAMLCARGKVERLSAGTLSWFKAPMPPDPAMHWYHPLHSAKPDRFYELMEELYPGPRVELHARRRRGGWHCFGNQLDAGAP